MNQIYNKNSQKYFINTTTGAPSIATMHYHNTYDIYYADSGKREYFVEDKIFTASTGDFVLIKAYSFHQIGEGNVLRTLVSFTDDFLANTFSPAAVKKLVKCFDTPLICPSNHDQAEFKNLLKILAKCKDSTAFALNLGMLLMKLSSTSSDYLYEERISNIVKYINQNFAEIHTKVKNACAFLETTDKSLTEICMKCGFSSSAYFSTVFKKNTGMAPLKYRQTHREKL